MSEELNSMTMAQTPGVNRWALIHVRYTGRRFDIPLVGLDLCSASSDVEIKHVIAMHLEVSDRRLDDYVVDRHGDGHMTLHLPARNIRTNRVMEA